MLRNAIVIALATINLLTPPAVASECTSTSEIAASRIRWATVRSQPLKPADNERICRAYAASFYELVTTRQNAASCIRSNDRQRDLALLDAHLRTARSDRTAGSSHQLTALMPVPFIPSNINRMPAASSVSCTLLKLSA